MLTPIFNLSQDNRFLIIKIRAPNAKLTEAEISYDSNSFLFNANPYFLRLFLTGEVIDDETGTCHFDSDKGIILILGTTSKLAGIYSEEFTICAPKKNPGEHFPRLEMLSELIKPQQKGPDAQRLVEIVGTNTLRNHQNEKENKPIEKSEMHEFDDENENGSEEEEATIKDGLLINGIILILKLISELLYAAQQIHKSNESFPDEEIIAKFGYGFGWVRNRVLGRFSDEISDLIDLDDPENVLIDARTAKLREFDEKHFQEQHYLLEFTIMKRTNDL
jgi:protein SHQ1